MKRLTNCGVLVATVVLVGCGPTGPEYVPVTGTVTLDGKPLRLKTVFFAPEDGTPGSGAGANTSEDGSYELLAVAGGAVEDVKGAIPGSYVVTVNEPMFPIESDMAVQGESDEPEVAMGMPRPPKSNSQPIPPQYTSEESSPLKVQVPESGGVINLELTSTR